MNIAQGFCMVNTNEPRNEREASANVKARPSDRDIAAMLASSGAIEGKSKKRGGLGLLLIAPPWVFAGLLVLGYFSRPIVEFFAMLAAY